MMAYSFDCKWIYFFNLNNFIIKTEIVLTLY